MKRRIFLHHGFASLLAGASLAAPLQAAGALPDTVARVKRSVVGVGTYLQTRSPAITFAGTGFVVGDGLSVITNAHVVPEMLDGARKETLGVVVGDGAAVAFRAATLVGLDREHDLAHLRLQGAPLPALNLAERDEAREGQALAFTGFPLGMVPGHPPRTAGGDHASGSAIAERARTRCARHRAVAAGAVHGISARWHCVSGQ